MEKGKETWNFGTAIRPEPVMFDSFFSCRLDSFFLLVFVRCFFLVVYWKLSGLLGFWLWLHCGVFL